MSNSCWHNTICRKKRAIQNGPSPYDFPMIWKHQTNWSCHKDVVCKSLECASWKSFFVSTKILQARSFFMSMKRNVLLASSCNSSNKEHIPLCGHEEAFSRSIFQWSEPQIKQMKMSQGSPLQVQGGEALPRNKIIPEVEQRWRCTVSTWGICKLCCGNLQSVSSEAIQDSNDILLIDFAQEYWQGVWQVCSLVRGVRKGRPIQHGSIQGLLLEEGKGTVQSTIEICEADHFLSLGVLLLIATSWSIEQYTEWNLFFS